jgi:hypothetical protein
MMHDQRFWKNVVKKDAALNPVDRVAEVLFGLIMVLSFTGTISVALQWQGANWRIALGGALVVIWPGV